MLRHKVLMQYREQAIEQSLRRIDLLEISPESDGLARQQIRRHAWCWRSDKGAADEIESRLAAHGFDQSTISAESLTQAREFFFLFQSLLDTAQSRRMSVLRDIKAMRHWEASSTTHARLLEDCPTALERRMEAITAVEEAT
ncbi:hypothetical protein IVB30_10520 [Bradyrhizobium sp. 200]|uniref:hypothetical protein n=1 Tax=Bradyrhizobium sp. 200 TaxID=2782665 RepID=UPI001FFFBCA3|nr:hypothetical protein [Bradyrhizobium sp. 200]UPJ51738.1 hypothetical protein IVB30_10520 [Bradyrhizobium sp. 200]